MKKLISMGVIALLSVSATAQIKVMSNGHILVGEKQVPYSGTTKPGGIATVDPIYSELIPDTTCSMTIDGLGVKHAGGGISFGSKGVASIGSHSTGVLQLKGSYGISYIGPSDNTVFYLGRTLTTSGSEDIFTYKIPVQATRFVTNSDMRQKTDIALLEGSGAALSSITPVSYRLNLPSAHSESDSDNGISLMSDSETTASVSSTQFGFLAQEVRNVYPELVFEDEEGNLSVDYQGFVPLLVDAVGQLQNTVETQQCMLDTLMEALGGINLMSGEDNQTQAYIGQNRPNPTNGNCNISYGIPESAVSAYIELSSTDGLTSTRYDIGERGSGTLTIDASRLNPGVYIYTLIVDNEEIGSHRMIVSY